MWPSHEEWNVCQESDTFFLFLPLLSGLSGFYSILPLSFLLTPNISNHFPSSSPILVKICCVIAFVEMHEGFAGQLPWF